MKPIRTFIALKLHPGRDFCESYNELKSLLREEKLRWVPEQNFHLTLRFLGDTPLDKISEISQVLDEVAEKTKPFKLTTSGTGFFGKRGKPSVFWIGFHKNEMLHKLALELAASIEKLGFERDGKAFKAHLTLARMKYLHDEANFRALASEFSDELFLSEQMNAITFYQSILHSSGPEYKVISRHDFLGVG